MSLWVLIGDKMFVTNEVSSIKDSDKLIEKYKKLSKSLKLSKLENLKGEKLFKSQK